MHLAVFDKNLGAVRALQELGAKATIKNEDGLSPIDYSLSDLDKVLLKYFRSIPEYVNEFRVFDERLN